MHCCEIAAKCVCALRPTARHSGSGDVGCRFQFDINLNRFDVVAVPRHYSLYLFV